MIKKITLKISGMHCTSCAMNIDGELEDTEGVKESNTNYARQETSIILDCSIINIEKIIKTIENLGYQVNSI